MAPTKRRRAFLEQPLYHGLPVSRTNPQLGAIIAQWLCTTHGRRKRRRGASHRPIPAERRHGRLDEYPAAVVHALVHGEQLVHLGIGVGGVE